MGYQWNMNIVKNNTFLILPDKLTLPIRICEIYCDVVEWLCSTEDKLLVNAWYPNTIGENFPTAVFIKTLLCMTRTISIGFTVFYKDPLNNIKGQRSAENYFKLIQLSHTN